MDVVISKSDNKNKKYKAVIDGKKQFISVPKVMKILQLIKIKTVNNDILIAIKNVRIGEQVGLILRGFTRNMFSGIRIH